MDQFGVFLLVSARGTVFSPLSRSFLSCNTWTWEECLARRASCVQGALGALASTGNCSSPSLEAGFLALDDIVSSF